ncbi:26S proteasome non-ATPase regulatory subunit 10 [Marchantia polymorpha subsp. ruderalis]|uniref:Uncharacterized protein n=2 Tax=Marchantia polymorpha TaxID=3197 RepID=A0A176W9T6_MARPO|nr:hypothetical protein AXG93_773s1480 [Marchantia polymorpha subsp. ruderalis]PTQ50088.1 hypothetical protein MARPO_0001s0139 [Marchantia polymorpha]BBM99013.1 hypothetical protein Mp_1g18010 [Marchantia polymorpha subsp. ruderalis]|eukprot:PTQ50088.1 hypothetical protein MARPO_0001s0139 [Marchantia polymorpha]
MAAGSESMSVTQQGSSASQSQDVTMSDAVPTHFAQPQDEAIWTAAEKGDRSFFDTLSEPQILKALTLKNEDGRSILHVAAAAGHSQVVSLLSDGVDAAVSGINAGDDEGWTPLHSAVSGGKAAVVEVLLASGADVNLANNGGRTALHYAASKGHSDIANMLISKGSKLNRKDKVGCTPLHRAASAGHSQVCEVLIEEGADIDATDVNGQTPITLATICDNRQVALLLLRNGADLDIEDTEGYTVLGRANDELRAVLIDAAKVMAEG